MSGAWPGLAIRAVCLAGLLAGIAWNVRFAIADLAARRNQPQAARLAMRLVPENPAYPAQLADEVYASDPAAAQSLLQRAVQLNRYDASSWIQLGLLREGADQLPQAEDALLQAARVDATYLPSWSLANFYFRRGNTDRFWYWAERAAHMAPDDATPLFRLTWYVSPNEGEVERRLQMSRPAIARQFVNFLVAQGDATAVAQAATHLLTAKTDDNTQSLLGVCDWLIADHHPELALPVWNGLAARGQIPYAQLEKAPGDAVTDGSFARSPLSRGFDWHLPTVAGVSSFLNANPNALGFEFSGEEPDSFALMNETAPVAAAKDYAMVVAYNTAGIAAGSGLAWQVTDERTGTVLGKSGSLSSEQGGRAVACFSVPEGVSFVNLSLGYQRQAGTVRLEGKLALQSVRLVAATAAQCAGKKISTPG